ncbi:uracil-DNA glycosylase family protein [Microvirga lotononidis]|uniref:uracil-DNA glycosylase family protein n=1 Tax=Microvirga lotononidis TaxID=864069 RepID=UPI000A03B371|nr:uracil-DNA glycosylase family protein [Microvirga lotononidis]
MGCPRTTTLSRRSHSKSDLRPKRLPDVPLKSLKIVFCGLADGNRSAASGANYAQPGNRFWSALSQVGLTSRQLQPLDFWNCPSSALAPADLAKGVRNRHRSRG